MSKSYLNASEKEKRILNLQSLIFRIERQAPDGARSDDEVRLLKAYTDDLNILMAHKPVRK